MKNPKFRIPLLFAAIVCFALASPPFAYAKTVTAKMYEKGSNRAKLLFTSKSLQAEKDGQTTAETSITDPEGKVVVRQNSVIRGTEAVRYVVEQLQLGKKGIIEVRDGRVHFRREMADGTVKTDDEKLEPNFVVSPSLVPYLASRWKEILDGKTVQIRFGVWDRLETVGFSLFKVGEEKRDGKDVVLVKMKPSSFVIAALVDPLIFALTREGAELVDLLGRVEPKRKVGNDWKDVDADTVYTTEP